MNGLLCNGIPESNLSKQKTRIFILMQTGEIETQGKFLQATLKKLFI